MTHGLLLPRLAMQVVAVGLAILAPALAVADPCTSTFSEIARSLELGKVEAALAHFAGSDRGLATLRHAAEQPESAGRLAAVFRSAKLKQAFDQSAIYAAAWEASPGHTYGIDIGVQVGATGCVVQAW